MRAALLLLLLATGPASAEGNEITLGPWNRALRASSADTVTDGPLVGGLLTYGRRLDTTLYPGLQLWVEGNFAWASATGTMFQTMSTDVGTVAFTAGARARYLPLSHVAVSARVDVGTARTSLTLAQGDYTASDSGWGAVATAAAGVDLLAAWWFGIRFELSYTRATGASLAPHSASDDSTLHLPMTAEPFGHLDLSGPAFHFAFVAQF
jgi:outer membrane protein with beta-barrel domain